MDRKKSHTFVVTKIVYSLSYQFVLFVVQQLGCFGLEVYHSRRYLTRFEARVYYPGYSFVRDLVT